MPTKKTQPRLILLHRFIQLNICVLCSLTNIFSGVMLPMSNCSHTDSSVRWRTCYWLWYRDDYYFWNWEAAYFVKTFTKGGKSCGNNFFIHGHLLYLRFP